MPKKKDKKKKPTTGQSAGPLQIGYDDLNKDERKLIRVLNGKTKSRVTLHLGEIASKGRMSNLEVRNALRRTVRGDWVEKVTEIVDDEGEIKEGARGYYRISVNGRRRIKRSGKLAA